MDPPDHVPTLDQIVNYTGILSLRYARLVGGAVEAEITMRGGGDLHPRSEKGIGDLPESAIRAAFAKFFSVITIAP